MDHASHVGLIRAGVEGADVGSWADVGAGTGASTLALADLLGPGGRITAVDRDAGDLRENERRVRDAFPATELSTMVADFTQPLGLEPLAGLVIANALHFIERRRQPEVVRGLAAMLRPGGRFVLETQDWSASAARATRTHPAGPRAYPSRVTPPPAPLPDRPPFTLRARLLTPLDGGGTTYAPDAAIVVDATGRIVFAGPWEARPARPVDAPPEPVVDLRPLVLLPGLVDLHVHLPQVPSAGLGAGLDLLTWLERHIFPLERQYDGPTAERLAPRVFRALAAAGTTTVVGYGAIWQDSLDVTFRAAEAHGIRAVIGKVMMDRVTYDPTIAPDAILERSVRESEELCQSWHGRDGGRLQYAFTPRFAVSCTAEMLAASAAAAARHGAYWQTHLSEDAGEMARVRELFPDARDYLDVYDRAGGIGRRAILAHAIHLSDPEVARLAEAGSAIAHCPASNLFLASGVMPLARYRAAGLHVGLGSDVAAAPELSIVTQMRTGFYAAHALAVAGRAGDGPLPGPLDWIALGSLEGARALGMADRIGSLEAGKEADLIAVDPRLTLPPGGTDTDDPDGLASRLIFREHPAMIRGAWVRGRLLPAEPVADRGDAA